MLLFMFLPPLGARVTDEAAVEPSYLTLLGAGSTSGTPEPSDIRYTNADINARLLTGFALSLVGINTIHVSVLVVIKNLFCGT